MEKEYACYKGDTFICIGTLRFIARYLGVGYDTIRTYKSKGIYIFVEFNEED